jgi:hypothetical protein
MTVTSGITSLIRARRMAYRYSGHLLRVAKHLEAQCPGGKAPTGRWWNHRQRFLGPPTRDFTQVEPYRAGDKYD